MFWLAAILMAGATVSGAIVLIGTMHPDRHA